MKEINEAIALLQEASAILSGATQTRAGRKKARNNVGKAITLLTKALLGKDLGPDPNPGTRG